ncbi:MAG: hypothetical protein U0792_18185 [Gemmataceae bacterium]
MIGFDGAIQMAQTGGPLNAYDGTTITNNSITVPADIDTLTSGVDKDPSDNVGILLGFGQNQSISNNTIQLAGNGVSNTANFAQSVGIETQTGLPGSYDGLQIKANTITVQNAQNAKPEIVIGVWENGHADSSNITISGNSFTNLSSSNNPAANLERGFRLTSHSSATTTVTYQDNTVSGANIGFQWLNTSDFGTGDFSSGEPIRLIGNNVQNAITGVLVQSKGAAYLNGNTFTSSLTTFDATGLSVIDGGRLAPSASTAAVENNLFSLKPTGSSTKVYTGISIGSDAGSIGSINNNNLAGNSSGKALVNALGTQVDAQSNWWGSTSSTVVAAQHTGLVDDGNFVTINPPVISSFTFPTLTVGTAITPITVTASGSPTPTLSASGLPNGLIFTDNGNGTGTISGTPVAGEGGGAHGLATGNPVVIDAAIGFPQRHTPDRCFLQYQ